MERLRTVLISSTTICTWPLPSTRASRMNYHNLTSQKIFVSGLHLGGSIFETKSVKARQNISLNSSHMKLPTAGFTGPIQHLTISGTYGSMPPMQRGQNQTCASKIRGTFTSRMRQTLSVPAQARKFCGAVPNLDNGRTPVLPLEPVEICYTYLNRIVPKCVHILADSSINRL